MQYGNLVGMKNFKNQKIHHLWVEEFSHKDDGGNCYWKCVCDCGEVRIIASGNLNGKVKSCGCHKKRSGKSSYSWKGVGDLGASFVSNLKSQAKFRDIEFNLSIEYLWNLFIFQDRKCALTRMSLYFTESYKEAVHNKGTASLDRIDSNSGYLEGNVQWVHKDVNLIKQDLSQSNFFILCRDVYLTLKDQYSVDLVYEDQGIQRRRLMGLKSDIA